MATRVDRDREDEPRGRRDRDDRDDRYDDEPPRSSRAARRSSRDEDDDEPRGRSRTRDDEDDRPRRRSSRDEEDDRPRRSSRDDEQEDRPRRRPARDEEEDRPRRRGRDDEDEDDRPRRRSSRDDEDDRPRSKSRDDDEGVGSGWAGSRRQREKARSSERFDLPDPEKDPNALVKCLEDEPFASTGVHWVDTRDGRKAFNCPGEDDCALCKAGHAPAAYDYFNIAYLAGKSTWKNAYIKAGIGLSKELETANGARSGPLSRPYYEVNQRGGRGNKSGPPHYKWDVVRERDLADEWEIDPLSDDELDELYAKRFRKSDVFRAASPEDLKAAAREVRDRD